MNSPKKSTQKLPFIFLLLSATVLSTSVLAGSATWSLTPQSSDWYTAANWVPETVPNGPHDVATFNGFSSILYITFPVGSNTVLDSIVVHSAPYYKITVGDNSTLTFVGEGTRLVGEYASDHLVAASGGTINFTGRSVSGAGLQVSGMALFQDTSKSIGNLNVLGGTDPVGVVVFSDEAEAKGVVNVSGAAYFNDKSTGSSLLLGVYGDGFADVSGHDGPFTLGQPYADGTIFLGSNNLTITSTFPHYDFPGTLTNGGASGDGVASLTKAGSADSHAVLTGSSSYTGGTTIVGGSLFIETDDPNSTPTGSGDVQVNFGGFGGKGNVHGNTIVGTGTGMRASLLPGKGHRESAGRLSIGRMLTFDSDGVLEVNINSENGHFGEVSARGVTITSGAQIEVNDRSALKMATGTVLVLIDNLSDAPIAGTFADLPDGSTVTVKANSYQANYEGGDGNDLTLTVIN